MDHDKIRMHLSAFKDGEVDETLKDLILHHLQSCDSCREELDAFDQIDSLVGGLPEISVPETFVSDIIVKTRAAESHCHWKLSFTRRVSDRFFLLVDSVLQMFPGYMDQRTGFLDEFGDFPPHSLGHAYLSLIGR